MPIPQTHGGLYYSDFLAELCRSREARSYLEIGVQNGLNLSKIAVDAAIGIDPDFALSVDPTAGKRSLSLFRMTSDAFFACAKAEASCPRGIDLAFLDGMHLFEYLLRDVYNTEAISTRSGLIAIHDCLPVNGEMIERVNNYEGRQPGPFRAAWTGDVWKIVPILQKYRPDMSVVLVDCAPTGLVCLTNLDPGSTVLTDRYLEIVREFRALPNDEAAVGEFYDRQILVAADDILSNFQQSLYFRT